MNMNATDADPTDPFLLLLRPQTAAGLTDLQPKALYAYLNWQRRITGHLHTIVVLMDALEEQPSHATAAGRYEVLRSLLKTWGALAPNIPGGKWTNENEKSEPRP